MRWLALALSLLALGLVVYEARADEPGNPTEFSLPPYPSSWGCFLGVPYTFEFLDNQIKTQFGELPLLKYINRGGQAVYAYWNPDTDTITIISIDPKTRQACVTGYGTDLDLVFGQPQ